MTEFSVYVNGVTESTSGSVVLLAMFLLSDPMHKLCFLVHAVTITFSVISPILHYAPQALLAGEILVTICDSSGRKKMRIFSIICF